MGFIRKGFSICILLMMMISSVVYGALDEEIALENQYSMKAQRLLDSVYGPGNFVVFVDIDLTQPQYEVKYTEESNAKQNEKKEDEVNILPGYPVIKNLAPGNLNQLPFDSVTTLIQPKVNKINVDLYVNKSFARGKVGKAKGIVQDLLGMDDKRDAITIITESFTNYIPNTSSDVSINRTPDELVTTQNIFYASILLLLLILIGLYVMFQNKQAKLMQSKGAGGSGGPGNINVSPNIEVIGKGGGSGAGGKISTEPPIKQFFDFVSEGSVEKLLYLIKREQLPIEQIAVITSFLEPSLAAAVIQELDPKNQVVVGLNMLSQRKLNRVSIEKLETHIRTGLECLAGGEHVFKATFDNIKDDTKKTLLQLLGKSNPDGYKKFRAQIVLFEDIKFLKDEELKILISEVSISVLQTAMVGLDKEVYQKLFKNLTGNAKNMVSQFIQLKGKSVHKETSEEARASIIKTVERLEKEGKLDLRGRIK